MKNISIYEFLRQFFINDNGLMQVFRQNFKVNDDSAVSNEVFQGRHGKLAFKEVVV